MEFNINWDKWHSGVRMILYNWPLLRGAVDVKFNEYCHKKLKQVKDYIDVKKYNFSNLSNEELEAIFCREVCIYLIEWETDERQLEDFLLIFINEVFDCMPDKNDNKSTVAARYIVKLYDDLMENGDTVFGEIKEHHEKNSGGIKFVNGQGPNDEENGENNEKMLLEIIKEKNDSSTASAPGKLDDSFSESEDEKPKKKKGKKNVTTADLDDEDKPKFIEEDNDEDDDDWVNMCGFGT